MKKVFTLNGIYRLTADGQNGRKAAAVTPAPADNRLRLAAGLRQRSGRVTMTLVGSISRHRTREPVDGVGMSVIVFDSKEHADQAAAYPLPPLPGVTPLTLEIREVFASG